MKHMKKLIVAALAVVTAVALCVPALAFAADGGTITITLPTEKQAPTVATSYDIFKVFDATVNADDNTKVNYTVMSGKPGVPDVAAQIGAAYNPETDNHFVLDAAGNVHYGTEVGGKIIDADSSAGLSEYAIAAIADYVNGDSPATTVTAQVGETSVTTGTLPYGYYYIATTSGTAVTIDSNNNAPTVVDKNIIPVVVKSAGTQYDAASLAAIAAVGTDQPYTAVITKTKGATNVVFEDTMTNQTYNGDLVVTVGGSAVAPGSTTYAVSGAAGDSSFKVTFVNDYIASLADDTQITLNYSGKITSDALSINPATNKAKLTSGNGNTVESKEIDVYNAKLTVVKTDGDKALEGAGFKLYKEVDNQKLFYQVSEENGVKVINWVADIADATEVMANGGTGKNEAVFQGLADGTYYLVESTTPSGYNTIADGAYSFTVAGDDYTSDNLEKSMEVINQSGVELPSTGGMGTTILYIVGGIMIVVAAVFLVGRRRAKKDEKSDDLM